MKTRGRAGSPQAAAPAPGIFAELITSGTVKNQTELRRVYTAILKRYHPDLAGETAFSLDFDRLKTEFLAAKSLLRDRVALLPADKAPFDSQVFMAEFRDLVARGFPVNERVVPKNKGYRKSIDFIASCLAQLFGDKEAFTLVNEQLRSLRDAIPRVYWYAMQILWNCFDAQTAGLGYGLTIARRHYDCIAGTLEKLGYTALDRLFLMMLGGL